jgi:hypothetical protein
VSEKTRVICGCSRILLRECFDPLPGGSGDPYVYECVVGFEEVAVYSCEQGPQMGGVELSEK